MTVLGFRCDDAKCVFCNIRLVCWINCLCLRQRRVNIPCYYAYLGVFCSLYYYEKLSFLYLRDDIPALFSLSELLNLN